MNITDRGSFKNELSERLWDTFDKDIMNAKIGEIYKYTITNGDFIMMMEKSSGKKNGPKNYTFCVSVDVNKYNGEKIKTIRERVLCIIDGRHGIVSPTFRSNI